MPRDRIIASILMVAVAFMPVIVAGDWQVSAASTGAHKVEATLFLASDYQKLEGWPKPSETINAIMDSAEKDKKDPEEVVICGDYTNDLKLYNYQLSPENNIAEIKRIMINRGISNDNIIFVQGNHDKLTESISESGLHEFDDYLIYVVNTQNDFPWCQGKTADGFEKVKNSAERMETCFQTLINKGETRPVIIAAHVPMHFTARTSSLHNSGDNLYSSLLFDVINKAAESLDIVYFYGHNHAKGWDCYMGGSCVFKEPGDELLIPNYLEAKKAVKGYYTTDTYNVKQINFTYMNAGAVGHYLNFAPAEKDKEKQKYSSDKTLTGTVCEIYNDEIVFTKYSKDGMHHISGTGCANPKFNDSILIPGNYYGIDRPSPKVVKRKHGKPVVQETAKYIATGKAGKKSVKYTWNKVSGAAKYKVYQSRCGKKVKCIKTTKATSFAKKNLKKGTCYKAYVAAYNKSGKKIATSPVTHVMTKGGKYSNATKVKARAKLSMFEGYTEDVNAGIIKKDSNKALFWKKHVKEKIRYYAGNPEVATVGSDGIVNALSTGTTYIYSVAPSGAYAVTKVVVE